MLIDVHSLTTFEINKSFRPSFYDTTPITPINKSGFSEFLLSSDQFKMIYQLSGRYSNLSLKRLFLTPKLITAINDGGFPEFTVHANKLAIMNFRPIIILVKASMLTKFKIKHAYTV